MQVWRLVIACAVQALEVAVLFSELTPFAYQSLLASLPPLPEVFLTPTVANSSNLQELASIWPEVVLDYGYSPGLSLRLLQTAQDSQVIGLYDNCPKQEIRGKAGPEEMAKAVALYLQAFNFTQVFLVTAATPFYQDFNQNLHSQNQLFTDVVNLRKSLSQAEAELFVGHILKLSGSPVAALFVDEDTGAQLLSALATFHLSKKGYVYLFSDEAVWATLPTGAIYVTDSVAVSARSRLQYECMVLEDQLRQLSNMTSIKPVSGQSRRISLSLVNIVNGIPLVVATSPHIFLRTVQFPGNTTLPPSLHKPVIEVSADFTARSFDGSAFPLAEQITVGTAIAYSEANIRSDIITGHQFVNNSVSFGGSVFNVTWAKSQVQKSRDKVGIAFHSFAFSGTAIATMKLFGWKRLAVVCSDAIGDKANCDRLVTYAKNENIEIVNAEANRTVPANLANNTQQLNTTLLEILSSTVRIIVISHQAAHLVFDQFYLLGARAGDYMVCLFYGLSPSLFAGVDEVSLNRRRVVKGAMVFFDRYFSGIDGPHVKELLKRRYGEIYNAAACIMYDNAMLVAYSVGDMLTRGLHFEHGKELVSEMRSIRFNGCLGVIQTDSGTNDRRAGDYSVQNVHLEGDNETFRVVEVAIYSPYKTQLFTLFPSLQFPDGSNSSFPDSWPEHPKCPYLVKFIESFPHGVTLGIAVNFCFAGLSGVSALATYKWWRRHTFKPLIERQSLSWEDSLALLSLPIEFVQLLALGPDLNIASALTGIGRLSLLHLEEFVNVSRGVFWVVETVMLVWVLVFIIQSGVEFLEVLGRLQCWCKWLEFWWDLIIPTLSNVLFLPTCFTLLSTFECQQATGTSFSDSFLDRDCYEKCWSMRHLFYIVVSAVCLCTYIPLAGITRPYWQALQSNLHVKATSLDLMVKSVFQTTLVAAYVSLQSAYPLAHASLYLCLLTCYTLFVFLTKGYNYERMNLWRLLLMLALLCYAGLGLAQINGLKLRISIIIWATICGLLLVAGLLAQRLIPRFRSLLVREKDDRYDIIKFAFTFGQQAQAHLRHFNEKLAVSRYSNAVSSQGPILLSSEIK